MYAAPVKGLENSPRATVQFTFAPARSNSSIPEMSPAAAALISARSSPDATRSPVVLLCEPGAWADAAVCFLGSVTARTGAIASTTRPATLSTLAVARHPARPRR
jgi:hypothetical protein